MKEIEDDTGGKVCHILGLEESIVSKSLYYQSNLQTQCNPYQITNTIFCRSRTRNLKICVEKQKPPNSTCNLEKEKWSWRNKSP